VVAVRMAIESTYIGTCEIIEYQSYVKSNNTTGFQEVIVLENQPCKLSHSSATSTKETVNVAAIGQVIKLFISPDITIKPGSKITVTQNDKTSVYEQTGESNMYNTHQEITLELFKGWS